VISAAGSTDDLLARIDGLTRAVIDRTRAEVRLSRFAAIATAQGRPEAREAIGGALGDLLDELAGLIREAQEKDLARSDLDPRAIATFIQSYSLGLIVHDLNADRMDADALVAVIGTALRAVLTPQG
jgi:hypothetical protein